MAFGGSSMGNVSFCTPSLGFLVLIIRVAREHRPAEIPRRLTRNHRRNPGNAHPAANSSNGTLPWRRNRQGPARLVRLSVKLLRCQTLLTHLSRVVHYDGNVYEDALVQEWLDEVRNAVHWYLGDGARVQDAGIQAKL